MRMMPEARQSVLRAFRRRRQARLAKIRGRIPEKDEEDKDEEGGGDKKDKGGGGMGGGGMGGGGSEKKDKPDDSEKKDKEGGDRAEGSGELKKMGANKVYGGWFTYGPGTCAEAALDESKQEEWLLTVAHQKLPLGSHS